MSSTVARPKRRLLVTGGLGFIGANVVRKLHPEFDIVVLDWKDAHESENTREFRERGIRIHRGDIAKPEVWHEIEPCDYVFHGAAQVSAVTSELDPVRDFQSNVVGTFLVAEYARRNSAGVIYCNSIRVYDPEAVEAAMQEHGAVSEACATVKQSTRSQPPFALSKFVGEECLLRYARMHSVPVISLRMSGVVGPGQTGSNVHGWLSHLISSAVNRNEFTVYGDGKQTRDVLHIADYLELIEMALNEFECFCAVGGAIYNVGGGASNELSIEQVAQLLRNDHGLDLKLVYQGFRTAEPRHYVSDFGLIAEKGWHPKWTSVGRLTNEIVDWHLRRRTHGVKTG